MIDWVLSVEFIRLHVIGWVENNKSSNAGDPQRQRM
jgi:hypothetical protein